MQLEVGATVEGKITRITKFGAFVELENGKTGLIHISEVSTNFVKQIEDYLKVGDNVKVKVLSVSDNGKIELSRKKVEMEEQEKSNNVSNGNHNFDSNKFEDRFKRNSYNNSVSYSQNKNSNDYFGNLKNIENSQSNNIEYNNFNRRNSNFGGNKNNDLGSRSNANKFEDMLMKFKKLSDEKLAGFEKTKSRRGRNSHKDNI